MTTIIIIVYLGVLLASVITLLAVVIYRERALAKLSGKPVAEGLGTADSFLGSDANSEEAGEKKPRFSMLADVDRTMTGYRAPAMIPNLTLREFCETFRNYSAGEKHLFYDASIIRQFVAGLSVSPILIMQGMSGTGKTSLARAFGYFISNISTAVPIQPMWKERSDLLGYFNEFTDEFKETELLKKMYEALYSDEMYVTILDEMNIARVEYYFADFLSMLEFPAEERKLQIISDKRPDDPIRLRGEMLPVPENMWFIGTANNDDSTFAISDKVYDRAMVINLDKKTATFTAPSTHAIRLSIEQWKAMIADARREYAITARNMERIGRMDNYVQATFHLSFGNRIMKQLRMYVPVFMACGGGELEAIDDLLSKKLMRKLESLNPSYVRSKIEDFKMQLNDIFGENVMEACIAYLDNFEITHCS